MNRIRILSASALVIGSLVAAGSVCAQARDGGPGRGGRLGGLGVPVQELNLSDAQQQQVRGIREQHQAALRQAEERLRAATQAQRSAVQTVPVNEGLIRSTTQALADAQTDAALEQARVYSEIWFVLSPQQQEQLKALQARRQSGPDGRQGRPERRRPGAVPAKP